MKILEKLFIEPFEKWYEKLLVFLPNLLVSLFLFVVGLVLGILLKKIFIRFFKAINLDTLCERFGVFDVLARGGIKDPVSVLIAKIIEWVTIFTFLIVAMQRLEIPTVERLLEKFFLYLPNVFLAALILLFGYLLSNFFGRASLIASVNAGLRHSGLIGKFVKFTIFVLSATMALEQLGIGRETVIIAFAIFFGGVVLAFAIAFGLGGREIAKDYMEKKMLKDNDSEDEITHI